MPANLTGPRPDIVFLRRRLKPGEVSTATPAQVSAPKSSGLNLNRERPSNNAPTSEASKPKSPVEPKLPGAVVPFSVGLSHLKKTNDAFRLNRRQSAIGSLVVENAMVAGWQMQDGSSGYIYNTDVTATESPETKPVEFMGRQLVQFHKELLIVGLRNVNKLKRLIIIPQHGKSLHAETVGGSGVLMDFEPFTVLYVSMIDSMIEFRKEEFRNTITDTFNLQTVKPEKVSNKNIPPRTLFS